MIKLVKKFQIKLTPFDATKDWKMSTNNNQDLLLLDTGSYQDPEVPIALEFIDYGSIGELPVDNFECDIALEQQPDDLVNTRLGLKTTGLFYPDKDPLNIDSTYKRVVYSQVKTMFYNTYKDVTKTWGVENIDFNLGKTQRKLSDEFRLFDIPQDVYGDRMVPHSIVVHDFSSDTDFEITDDSNGNLIAGTNLFSRQQEIGKHLNQFISAKDNTCDSYFNSLIPPPTASVAPSTPLLFGGIDPGTASLFWTQATGSPAGYTLEKSVGGTGSFSTLASLSKTTLTYLDILNLTGSLIDLLSAASVYYRVYSFNSIGSSSYSNIVKVPDGVYDTFDSYAVSQSSGFNQGSGSWVGSWKIDQITRFVSSESFDTYTIGQTSSFNQGLGWVGSWVITGKYFASESFDTYTIGQTASFDQGFGWSLPWRVTNTMIILQATESFNEYIVGQTSNFTGSFGWSTPFVIK